MYSLFTYQRYWDENKHDIDCHVGNCIREKHSESIHAFLLEDPKRSPIGFEVLAASRGNRDEESHHP